MIAPTRLEIDVDRALLVAGLAYGMDTSQLVIGLAIAEAKHAETRHAALLEAPEADRRAFGALADAIAALGAAWAAVPADARARLLRGHRENRLRVARGILEAPRPGDPR